MFRAFREDEPGGPPRPGGAGGSAGAAGPEWLQELLASRRPAEPEEERNLYCFVCGEVITSVDQRFALRGSAEYTFTNPGGFVYTIGCFRKAEGCEEAGELSETFSWFPEYAWRYAFCATCRVHLGWVYEGPRETPERFFGLIANRLVKGREGFPSTS